MAPDRADAAAHHGAYGYLTVWGIAPVVRGSQGFSLIEMLLALALGSVVTVSVAELFAANHRTHGLLTGQARMQESARHALDFMARSARAAGHLGCAGGPVWNTLNGRLGDLFELDIPTPVTAFDGVSADGTVASWTPGLDGLPRKVGRGSVNAFRRGNGIRLETLVPLSDILVFRFVDAPRPLAAQTHPGDDPVVLGDGDVDFRPDDFAVLADCEQAALFRVERIEVGDGRATLRRRAGSGSFENAPGRILSSAGISYGAAAGPAGAGAGRLVTHIYYVAAGAGANNRGATSMSLWRKAGTRRPAELVPGIEDLQVLLGLDTDGDGAVNRYAAPAFAMGRVRSVRMAVTATSVDAVEGDRVLRRMFVRTVALRN